MESKKEKDFIELLLFMNETTISEVQNAISLLKKINPTNITTEKIKSICNRDNTNYIENYSVNIIDNANHIYTEIKLQENLIDKICHSLVLKSI